MKVIINTDGASKGNPGISAIGVTIKDEKGVLLAGISRRIGRATNNQAEYRAVIAALERALELGANRVLLHADSELVVKQIKRYYRVKKDALKPLYRKAIDLIGRFDSFDIKYIARKQNREADRLANKVL
jgi:ribonuclease HI